MILINSVLNKDNYLQVFVEECDNIVKGKRFKDIIQI